MRCSKCGNKLPGGAKICTKCGTLVGKKGPAGKAPGAPGGDRRGLKKSMPMGAPGPVRPQKSRSGLKTVAILVAVALALGLGGFGIWKLIHRGGEQTAAKEDFSLMGSGFTQRKITDTGSARKAVGDVAKLLGIQAPDTELGACMTQQVEGNAYYRFSQEYEGIPVYGRSVVVGADSEGGSLTLSGNYQVPKGVSTSPKLEEAEAILAAEKYYGSGARVESEGLSIYSLNGCAPTLTWQLMVYTPTTVERCFISAGSGEVVAQNSQVFTVSAMGGGYDLEGNVRYFITENVGGGYSLEDTGRNIHVYNAGWDTLSIGAYGAGGKYYMNLTTPSRGELSPDWNGGDWWDDSRAVTAMSQAAQAYDFYDQVLNRRSFGGVNSTMHIVYNDYMNGDTTNAYACGGNLRDVCALSFGTECNMSHDTVGHEFTHSVEQSISGMCYVGESGALMEAYSDIFGELFEDWAKDGALNGDCNWTQDTYSRDYRDPASVFLPYEYQGEYWRPTQPTYNEYGQCTNDQGGVHYNCTVISYAAYLMCHGVNGRFGDAALTTRQLADLFYETLFTLPADCSFSQFCSLLENMATVQMTQRRMSYENKLCVFAALEEVGISSETVAVKSTVDLDIYNYRAIPYYDYTVYVDGQPVSGASIEENGLRLPGTGIYEIVIVDNANTDNQKLLYFWVLPEGGASQVPVYTHCGIRKYVPPASTPTPAPEPEVKTAAELCVEAARATMASGGWTEMMTMQMDMTMWVDEQAFRRNATTWWTAVVSNYPGNPRVVGNTRMSGTETELVYDLLYEDGVGHITYTSPYERTVERYMDPGVFRFDALGTDMFLSARQEGEHIYCTIPGHRLGELGVSPTANLGVNTDTLSYGDVSMDVVVDADTGKIAAIDMEFPAVMVIRGCDTDVSYHISYTF